MKKIRKRLSPEEAEKLGFVVKANDSDGRHARYALGGINPKKVLKLTSNNFDLSAWGKDGKIMTIEQFCEHHNLPLTDIRSHKLCTHTKVPTYNIDWTSNVKEIKEELDYSFIEEVVKKHIAPVAHTVDIAAASTFDRLVYTDVHVGMHPNKSGHSLYGGVWNEHELMDRCATMVDHILHNQTSDFLIVDDLGDLLDGWDGQTVRKGHSLPQNMTNQVAFDVAVRFKVALIDMIHDKYNKILLNNICEDNHAGAFGYVVNSAVKSILEQKYSNVQVVNHMKFINHYYVGDHCFVISHGKDSHALKFGFKPHLDPKQIEKIDQYLKQAGVYKRAKFIEFSKGDSHQMLFDYCTSDDFDYCNYPALSPSSEWVQTNFKKGRSGFVMQVCEYDGKNKKVIPYFF